MSEAFRNVPVISLFSADTGDYGINNFNFNQESFSSDDSDNEEEDEEERDKEDSNRKRNKKEINKSNTKLIDEGSDDNDDYNIDDILSNKKKKNKKKKNNNDKNELDFDTLQKQNRDIINSLSAPSPSLSDTNKKTVNNSSSSSSSNIKDKKIEISKYINLHEAYSKVTYQSDKKFKELYEDSGEEEQEESKDDIKVEEEEDLFNINNENDEQSSISNSQTKKRKLNDSNNSQNMNNSNEIFSDDTSSIGYSQSPMKKKRRTTTTSTTTKTKTKTKKKKKDEDEINQNIFDEKEECFLCEYGDKFHDGIMAENINRLNEIIDCFYGIISNEALALQIHYYYKFNIYREGMIMLEKHIALNHIQKHVISAKIFIGESIRKWSKIRELLEDSLFIIEDENREADPPITLSIKPNFKNIVLFEKVQKMLMSLYNINIAKMNFNHGHTKEDLNRFAGYHHLVPMFTKHHEKRLKIDDKKVNAKISSNFYIT
jgi:hypothetical protein